MDMEVSALVCYLQTRVSLFWRTGWSKLPPICRGKTLKLHRISGHETRADAETIYFDVSRFSMFDNNFNGGRGWGMQSMQFYTVWVCVCMYVFIGTCTVINLDSMHVCLSSRLSQLYVLLLFFKMWNILYFIHLCFAPKSSISSHTF